MFQLRKKPINNEQPFEFLYDFFCSLIELNKITNENQNYNRLTKRTTIIGRDPNSDLVIPSNVVSKKHATITYQNVILHLHLLLEL